jgi:hypothetical protein
MPLPAANRVCLRGFGHSSACIKERALQGKTLALMRGDWGAEEARRAVGAEEGMTGGGGAAVGCGGVGGETHRGRLPGGG